MQRTSSLLWTTSDPGIGPIGHIYMGFKAPWFEITDDLPQWKTTP